MESDKLIKDTFTSIKSTLFERVSSPLAGSFIFSWIIWNWKLLVTMFFGDEDTSTRINTIITKYYDVSHLITYPLMSTTLLILFYPLLSFVAFACWEWIEPTKRRLKAYFEGKTPLTNYEAKMLRARLNAEREEMDSIWKVKEDETKALKIELDDQNAIIDDLKSDISKLKAEKYILPNEAPTGEVEEELYQLSDDEDEILRFLAESNLPKLGMDELRSHTHYSLTKMQYIIDELKSKELLLGSGPYMLNAKSRKYLANAGLLD